MQPNSASIRPAAARYTSPAYGGGDDNPLIINTVHPVRQVKITRGVPIEPGAFARKVDVTFWMESKPLYFLQQAEIGRTAAP